MWHIFFADRQLGRWLTKRFVTISHLSRYSSAALTSSKSQVKRHTSKWNDTQDCIVLLKRRTSVNFRLSTEIVQDRSVHATLRGDNSYWQRARTRRNWQKEPRSKSRRKESENSQRWGATRCSSTWPLPFLPQHFHFPARRNNLTLHRWASGDDKYPQLLAILNCSHPTYLHLLIRHFHLARVLWQITWFNHNMLFREFLTT